MIVNMMRIQTNFSLKQRKKYKIIKNIYNINNPINIKIVKYDDITHIYIY